MSVCGASDGSPNLLGTEDPSDFATFKLHQLMEVTGPPDEPQNYLATSGTQNNAHKDLHSAKGNKGKFY